MSFSEVVFGILQDHECSLGVLRKALQLMLWDTTTIGFCGPRPQYQTYPNYCSYSFLFSLAAIRTPYRKYIEQSKACDAGQPRGWSNLTFRCCYRAVQSCIYVDFCWNLRKDVGRIRFQMSHLEDRKTYAPHLGFLGVTPKED